jgi:hypothetical protein
MSLTHIRAEMHPATLAIDVRIPYPTREEIIPAGTTGTFTPTHFNRFGAIWGLFETSEGRVFNTSTHGIDIHFDQDAEQADYYIRVDEPGEDDEEARK